MTSPAEEIRRVATDQLGYDRLRPTSSRASGRSCRDATRGASWPRARPRSSEGDQAVLLNSTLTERGRRRALKKAEQGEASFLLLVTDRGLLNRA
jgi:hypothetical protein